jgi:hypothetical protein
MFELGVMWSGKESNFVENSVSCLGLRLIVVADE